MSEPKRVLMSDQDLKVLELGRTVLEMIRTTVAAGGGDLAYSHREFTFPHGISAHLIVCNSLELVKLLEVATSQAYDTRDLVIPEKPLTDSPE